MRQTTRLFALGTLLGLSACLDSPTHTGGPSDRTVDVEQRAPGAAAIAFVSTRDGAEHIYVAGADGSEVTRVTQGTQPAWSHDGRRIAFVRGGRILVMNVDGSSQASVGSGQSPAWSPDGRIAFVRYHASSPEPGLYVMNADGSGVTKLLGHSWLCPPAADCGRGYLIAFPTWSPDGQSIAFFGYMGGAMPRAVGIVGADGSSPRLLERLRGLGQGVNTRAAWSPDGSGLAVFTGNPWLFSTYDYVLYRYDLASDVLEEIHAAPGFGVGAAADHPDWSPDGRHIVFDAASREGDPRMHRRIYAVSLETGAVQRLIPEATDPAVATYRDHGAVWSRASR